MRVIGLTGGIASGKSTVGRLLASRGIPVIDADQVARQVVAPGSDGLQSLVSAFGPEILDADGALDRAAMRDRMTRDPEARATLERITHPAIRASMLQTLADLAAAGTPIAVVEAALLVETGSHVQYPELWVVAVEPDTQLRRLMRRDGMTEETAQALIATQLPMADKVAVATHVIHNDGELEDLNRQIDALL